MSILVLVRSFLSSSASPNTIANTRRDDHDASILLYHLNQMSDLGDHAARLRRISELGNAPDLVEPQADQRLALAEMPPQRTAGLADSNGLATMLFGTHSTLHA